MLTIYSIQTSPRLEYICDVLLKEQLGLDYVITSELSALNNKFVINYSEKHSNEAFNINPHHLLFEKDIQKQPVDIFHYSSLHNSNHQTPAFFKNPTADFPFDIFAASFYLLSRYEEYLPYKKDSYGRFAHEQSLAYQHHFLHLPLVNIWLLDFKNALQYRFEGIIIKMKKARTILTYDIDIAWSYKNKGLLRNVGGFFKNPGWDRIAVLSGLKKDPFDAYEFLDGLHDNIDTDIIYFFLVAKQNSEYDKNISPENDEMKSLIASTAKTYEIGIHPSWSSNSDAEKMKSEIISLEKSSGKNIIASRQHYIRFNLPDTFQLLIKNGIERDYSMGYGSINGFRASFAGSFYWYSLTEETTTTLRLYPFCYMDANSHYEQHEDAETAYQEMMRLKDACNKTNGLFISVFHNNFLGTAKTFRGWRDMYEKFISQLRS